MLETFLFIIDYIIKLAVGFYHSGLFTFIKFVLAAYTLVLFADIVLLLFLRGLGKDFRKMIRGADLPSFAKDKFSLRWDGIKKRLESGSQSQYKAAILEADNVVGEMLQKIGYAGKNMTERLEKANVSQIENLEELRKSHQTRNKIVHNKDFVVDLDVAKETIKAYEDFLRFIDIL